MEYRHIGDTYRKHLQKQEKETTKNDFQIEFLFLKKNILFLNNFIFICIVHDLPPRHFLLFIS